ncbi:diguanylate cyclase [Clostridium carboxidivorans P7]|uniref:Diguanylate cyclase n=1 Tax=Clostridium carboxidivorans P7 TaxID=536227 RepID=C6PRY3_9CLOT|nr:GGDEF domain-containing protein [Clostridium carboxidivorans]AKN30013.1 diguanylate cyclase [Clostridium carboxidivorans P7]EET88035.1 diguanylate cyclase [Clostridium carboxidivorans P7]EFG89008.1 diguanylate cyclase (GGDEF) domain protein [Clostridium carboxidivorans P7]
MMNKLSFFNKSNYAFTKEQKCKINHDLNASNITRIKLFLVSYMIFELVFILFNDIPYMMNPSFHAVWNDNRFFILHLIILFVSIIGIVLIKILGKYEECRVEKIYKLLIPILTSLLLSSMAIINGLDLAVHGNITSVFIANLIIFSAVILMRFPLNLVVYSIPFLVYIGGLVIFQHNVNSLISNGVNGLIYFLAVILISTVIYNNYYEKIAKNIILEETIFKLDYLSNHDILTGLLNRRCFSAQASEKMKILTETKKAAALILVDIDYFKDVNDKLGHPIGDIVLKETSRIFMEHIKPNDLITRWGGEEFLVFLFDTSIDEAYVIAEKIRVAIQDNVIVTDKIQIKITASFGISLLKDNFSESFDASYKSADVALYQAKEQGRNKVVIASLDM